ncbi:MAG: hypothetical protein WCF90_10050 [Methanomicrobiales archaeon]
MGDDGCDDQDDDKKAVELVEKQCQPAGFFFGQRVFFPNFPRWISASLVDNPAGEVLNTYFTRSAESA